MNLPVLDRKGCSFIFFLFSSDSSQPGFLRFRVGLLGGLGVMFGI